MKNLLLTLLISFNVFAAISWKERVRPLLPAPLQEFESGKTTLKEIEAKLGKASLTEGNKSYWERDGLKYALELTFEKETLQSLHYTFTGKKPALDILKGSIDLTKFSPYPSSGKSAGRFLKLTDKNAELVIDPVSKTIQTVRLP